MAVLPCYSSTKLLGLAHLEYKLLKHFRSSWPPDSECSPSTHMIGEPCSSFLLGGESAVQEGETESIYWKSVILLKIFNVRIHFSCCYSEVQALYSDVFIKFYSQPVTGWHRSTCIKVHLNLLVHMHSLYSLQIQ